jgi:hypothetical protein
LSIVCAPAYAQSGSDYEMTWYTVDSGGVTFATGGDYEAGVTVGQPEMAVQTGGDYTVESGFWYASAGGPSCTDDEECDDSDACTYDACVDSVCSNEPRIYGDVNGDGVKSLFDIFCILDLIGGSPVAPECNALNADIEPCAGNGVLSLLDVLAVLNAIGGADPCCE